jgi:hypothetical protein
MNLPIATEKPPQTVMSRIVEFVVALPILVVVLGMTAVYYSVLLSLRLPVYVCERLRNVRWLPWLGFGYSSSVAIWKAGGGANVNWPMAAFGTMVMMQLGQYFLPNILVFVTSPRKYRAVIRAISFVERQRGPCVEYHGCRILATESARVVVRVPLRVLATTPIKRRVIGVDADGGCEDLPPDEAARLEAAKLIATGPVAAQPKADQHEADMAETAQPEVAQAGAAAAR